MSTQPQKIGHGPMKSLLYATSILSASWFVMLVVGLVSSKVLAVILGPEGFGYYGILQNFVELMSMIGGAGIGTALVRAGAQSAAQEDSVAVASLRGGAWLIVGITSVIIACALVIFRVPLSRAVLESVDHPSTIALMALAILFTQANYVEVNVLNAHHRVETLAKYGVWSKVLGAIGSVAIIIVWRKQGIVPAVIITAVTAWLPSRWYLIRDKALVPAAVSLAQAFSAAKVLLRFGVPYLASVALSRGVQLVLPILILHQMDAGSVGNYRAASAIAVTYLGFLVTAMNQDYFPRLSASVNSPHELNRLVNDQQRLILLISLPTILGMMAFAPYLMPLVYSSKFTLAVGLLEWLLISDLFKFSAWTMSNVILVKCGPGKFFLAESMFGVSVLATSWAGARWLGFNGLGIALLVSYVLYFFVVWLVVRRETGLVWSSSNVRLLSLGIVSALALRILPSTPLNSFRAPLAVLVTVMACGWSGVVMWHEMRGSVLRWAGVSPRA